MHIISNSLYCIDLIFRNNPNIFSKHDVDISIFDKCHHNIIYGSVDIGVSLQFSYTRDVWNYSRANVTHTQQSIIAFDLTKTFENLSFSSKVDVLNETLLNIPNKTVKCDFLQPPWIIKEVKKLLKGRTRLHRHY